jgi:hypothetical protein
LVSVQISQKVAVKKLNFQLPFSNSVLSLISQPFLNFFISMERGEQEEDNGVGTMSK